MVYYGSENNIVVRVVMVLLLDMFSIYGLVSGLCSSICMSVLVKVSSLFVVNVVFVCGRCNLVMMFVVRLLLLLLLKKRAC